MPEGLWIGLAIIAALTISTVSQVLIVRYWKRGR